MALVNNAHAASGPFIYNTGTGTPQSWEGYGDSIMAGYCGLFCTNKSYASYYADDAALENGWDITLDSDAVSGHLTSQIYNQMDTDRAAIRVADLVIWDGGGNDFLDARDAFRANCDEAALNQAMIDWRTEWDQIIDLIALEASPTAMIRTMNLYYPGVTTDRSNFCGQKSHFETFFPLLIEAGEYMCSTVQSIGGECADVITAVNCREIDSNHTIDPDCIIFDGFGKADPITSNFKDANSVVKYVNGNPISIDMLVSDDTHPTNYGNQYIADAHHALGYGGSSCGDGTCDIDEDPLSCSADCPDVCGDGLCSGGEDPLNCNADCPDVCGDGVCSGPEDTTNCTSDCGSLCGDGVCNGTENNITCLEDCPPPPTCTSDGAGCTDDVDCCSGNCDNSGKPANRTYTCLPGAGGATEDCSNGIDDDGDGAVDCADSDCSGDPACGGGTCGHNKDACTVDADCCSLNCKGGQCKGG